MMSSVLLRPKRPLPRRFNRRVSPVMRSFAVQHHRRRSRTTRDRASRWWRRIGGIPSQVWEVVRRWWYVALGSVVAVVVAVVFFSPLLTVREIRVQRGQGRVDVAAVQKVLSPFFGERLLSISTHDIVETVRTVVPDLEQVHVEKQYPSRLFLRVTVKPLVARVVFEEPVQQRTLAAITASGAVQEAEPAVKKYDYLAENGMYVSTFSAASGSTLPTITLVDWGARPVPGAQLLDADFLQHLQQAETALTQEFGHKIAVRKVYLRAREFHLSIGKLSLWFDVQSPLEEQLRRYRTFLRTVGSGAAGQYVDLRLKGRVVYR